MTLVQINPIAGSSRTCPACRSTSGQRRPVACSAGLADLRKGPRRDRDYTMVDGGLSAFSRFFMGSPSFLAHQRVLERGHGRSNRHTLFGMSAIPLR
jgi:hypothetical protein